MMYQLLKFITISLLVVLNFKKGQPLPQCEIQNHLINPTIQDQILNETVNPNSIQNLLIKTHIVQNSVGEGGISFEDVIIAYNQMIEIMDQNNVNINFQISPLIDYINQDEFYYLDSPEDKTLLANTNNEPYRLDVYFVPEMNTCGTVIELGSSSMLIQNDCAFDYSVLAHELGHCLGLYHTHTGTNPHETFDGSCSELVDGSNGEICGDYIEDTPADPGLFHKVDSLCTITQSLSPEYDNNGVPYSPDTDNVMSYSYPTCRINYSEKQVLKMKQTLQALDLNYDHFIILINKNYLPPFENLGGTLNIDNLNNNQFDFNNVPSGDMVPVKVGDSYLTSTNHIILKNKKHYIWNSNHSNIFLVDEVFGMALVHVTDGEISAKFHNQITINNQFNNLMLQDPWFIHNTESPDPNDWIQNGNEWVNISNTYTVFKNQNEDHWPNFPIYSLFANEIYDDNGILLTCVDWSSTDVNGDGNQDATFYNHPSHPNDFRYCHVVFNKNDVTVQPIYVAVEEPVFISLEDMSGNTLFGSIQVSLAVNPITGETEDPTYDGNMYIGGTYTFTVPSSIGDLYLHDWNENIHFENNTFTVVAEAGMNDIVVRYKEKHPITLTTYPENLPLKLFNPWVHSSTTPPQEWTPIESTTTIFLNETNQVYKVFAPLAVDMSNGTIMTLSEFEGTGVTLYYNQPELLLSPINVIFEEPNAHVTAIYSPAGNAMTGPLPTTLNGDVILYGEIEIHGKSYINGSVLIVPGTQIHFDSRERLTIDGQLICEGDAANFIQFTGGYGSQFNLNHTQLSPSAITYSSFNGVDCILKDGNTNDIQNILDVSLYASTFTNQTYAGVLIENESHVEINQCQFFSTTIGCAVGELSHVKINQSSFNNGVIGLYTFLGGDVTVKKSTFTQLDRGLFSSGNSFIDLTQDIDDPLTHCWQINNAIFNNFTGCELETPSRQILGIYHDLQAQGHELDFIGFNRLYNNETDIFNPERNSIVKAQGNSWTNQSTLAQYTCEDGMPNITGEALTEPFLSQLAPDGPLPNQDALIDEMSGNYDIAIETYQAQLSTATDSSTLSGSIAGLSRSYSESYELEQLLIELEQYESTYPNTFLEHLSLSLQASYYYHQKTQTSLITALDKMEIMYTKYPETQSDPHELLKEAKIIKALESQSTGAGRISDDRLLDRPSQSVLQILVDEHEEHPAGHLASLLLKDASETTNTTPLPTKFTLHPAFPNPFNPTTTIKYEIPEQSQIKLQIFDITGRLVNTITDNEQIEGTHQTQWHGTNQLGEQVSSGMYIVRMDATSTHGKKSFTQSQKIVLMK